MLLVDGHNLIGRTPELSLSREERSREQVLQRISAVKGSGGERVVVVFDGNRPGSAKQCGFGGIQVVYAPEGRTADDEILRRVAGGHSSGITVVTSDRQLADRVRGRGGRTETCEVFWRRLHKRRGARRPPADAPAPAPEDVEEWLELFRAGTTRSEKGHKI